MKDYSEYVKNKENGLIHRYEDGNYYVELLYKPTDFVILSELKKKELKKSEYDKVRLEIEGLQYFDLTIGTNVAGGDMLNASGGGMDEYINKLSYFLTEARSDMKLIDGSDTLYPQLYHMERNYGGAPFNKVLLAFESTKNTNDKTLIVDDQVLGFGRLKFKTEESALSGLPKLKIED